MKVNQLFYGDNLEVLRRHVRDETINLCYIDPPFNSKRNYNQIYNNVGAEDRAQAQAFMDTWVWDDLANSGFSEIIGNAEGRFQAQLVDLIKGLRSVLKTGSLLAYLVSMSLRVTEIQRALTDDGSFFLHCDPTASHYLKIILDSIFCSQGGHFKNEIIWCYNQGGKSKNHFGKKHDVLFWYSKTKNCKFNGGAVRLPLTPHKQDKSGTNYGGRMGRDADGREYVEKWGTGNKKLYRYYLDEGKIPEDWWVDINSIQSDAGERQGYPTQKPEKLMERVILACSDKGDTVLDAYCGCGTTVVVSQRLDRRWIGIDITFQSIALVLKRLEEKYDAATAAAVLLNGIPKDMESAEALAHKKDDRLRKEFEKWAILTYTKNRAVINQKKGADGGIDGIAYFKTGKNDNAKIIFQVKSGAVKRSDVAMLIGDMQKVGADMATLLTLESPTPAMIKDAKSAGQFFHEDMSRSYDRLNVVKIKDIVESGFRLDIPMSLDVLKAAQKDQEANQLNLF